MKKSYSIMALAILLLSLMYVGCKKGTIESQGHRLSEGLKMSLDKIGKQHNIGLTDIIRANPDWFSKTAKSGIGPIYSEQVRTNSKRVNTDEIGGMGFLDIESREYFRNYTISTFPEFSFDYAILDSLNYMPSEFWMNPDSAVAERITASSPITLSSNFYYVLDQLIYLIHNSSTANDFNNSADNLMSIADTYLSSDVEFYAMATGIAIAKQSITYWETPANIAMWESVIASMGTNSITTNSLRKNSSIQKKTNLVMNDDLKGMAIADAAGAIRGGILGATVGSVGGPAGTISGALGGALFTGLRASTMAGAWRIIRRFF